MQTFQIELNYPGSRQAVAEMLTNPDYLETRLATWGLKDLVIIPQIQLEDGQLIHLVTDGKSEMGPESTAAGPGNAEENLPPAADSDRLGSSPTLPAADSGPDQSLRVASAAASFWQGITFVWQVKARLSPQLVPLRYRRMVPEKISFELLESWPQGTFALDFRQLAVSVTGQQKLLFPPGKRLINGKLTCKVPLLGGQLERQALTKLSDLQDLETAAAKRWLGS